MEDRAERDDASLFIITHVHLIDHVKPKSYSHEFPRHES
jgi:hypothetical protein